MPGTIGNTNPATGKMWRAAINRALAKRSRVDAKEALDDLAEKLLSLCDQGELGALKELGDRIDGKAVQGVELSGNDGGAIEQNLTVTFVGAGTSGEA